MAPVATPTPADLDRQAAKLREQAAGLDRRQAAHDEQDGTDFGTRIDDAKRSAASARTAAEAATKQATDLHDKAKESLAWAKRMEDDAARVEAEGSVYARTTADDLRDQAQMFRSSATADTRRAERAEQAARQQLADAERHDREALQTERSRSDRMTANDALRHAANKLEDKANALELAADKLRTAAGAPDPALRELLTRQASEHLAEADRISPDFSRIDAQDIVAAGIPMSEVPGAELMDPRSLVEPEPLDLHDTDLMVPGSLDPVAPGSAPASAPIPVDANGTDLMDPMDPNADPVLGPGSSGDDALLLGPDAPQPSLPDPLDRARADLAGDPDPYGDVPEAGDFGFEPTPVAAPAQVAVASASVDTDAYMDQPDIGSTSSYTDAFADPADDMTGEYA